MSLEVRTGWRHCESEKSEPHSLVEGSSPPVTMKTKAAASMSVRLELASGASIQCALALWPSSASITSTAGPLIWSIGVTTVLGTCSQAFMMLIMPIA